MISSMDQPQNTSFPASESSHRGKHELLADFLNRRSFYSGSNPTQGRHETRILSLRVKFDKSPYAVNFVTPDEAVDIYMDSPEASPSTKPVTAPPHVEGEFSGFSYTPTQARITKYKHLGDITDVSNV